MLHRGNFRPRLLFVFGVVVLVVVLFFIYSLGWKPDVNKLLRNYWAPTESISNAKAASSSLGSIYEIIYETSSTKSSSPSTATPTTSTNFRPTPNEPLGLVTRRIHQTWKTHNLPPRFQLYSATWKSCFPSWEYKLWDDKENRELIRTNFSWFLQTYDSFPHNIYRADAIRYFLMYTYGGIYTDLDTDCLKPFEHLLQNYSIVFGAMEGVFSVSYDGVYIQNSFFYSRPGHQFWLDVAHEMIRIRRGPQAEWVTGPIMMTGLMNRVRSKYQHQWKVYAPEYFNPFSWIHNSHPMPGDCKALNRMSLEDYHKCRQYFVDRKVTYVVQYHSQTWGSGKIL